MNNSADAALTSAGNVACATQPNPSSQHVEQQLDQVDKLFAQLDAGDFDLEALNYPWPAESKLSVVIPVYNEEATILQVISRIRALPIPKEIIVVDDCSTDGTRNCLET